MTVRVLLVDDHRLVREALRDTLSGQPGLEIVGEAGSGAEALEQARRLQPDVVVIDIRLPDVSGIETTARLRQQGCEAHIVALSAYSDSRFIREMLQAGAQAYVTKSAAGTELLRAVEAVCRGQAYFSPEAAAALAATARAEAATARPARLAPREKEVLRLIAEGLRTSEIGQQLQITPATVEVHRRNIMRKLELHTVAELTRYAVREGLAPL